MVGAEEDDGFLEAEDFRAGRDPARWDVILQYGRRQRQRVEEVDASERCFEEGVDDAESYCGADADFCADEEGDPEGGHAGDEVGQGGFPVAVEDGRWGDDVEDCGDDDGGEGGIWDPEEGWRELEDAEEDEASSDEATQWGFDACLGVDCGSWHRTSCSHARENAVEEIDGAEGHQLLAFVDYIVVFTGKSFGDGEMF